MAPYVIVGSTHDMKLDVVRVSKITGDVSLESAIEYERGGAKVAAFVIHRGM